MKKTLIALIISAVLASCAMAGDIGNIIGVDLLIGAAGGAAMGCALATPSYMSGDQKDATTFLVGAGWGALAGSIVGLAYGVYGVIEHVNMRSKSKTGMIEPDGVFVEYNTQKCGLQFTRVF